MSAVPEGARTVDELAPAPGSRMIALDVDGTLMTPDGFISSETRALVAALRDAGTRVVLATGRPLVAALPVAYDLGLEGGWVVASNGSVTARAEGPEGFTLDETITFRAGGALEVILRHMPDIAVAIEEVGVGYWVNAQFPDRTIMGRQTVHDLELLADLATTRLVAVDTARPAPEFTADVAGLGLALTHFSIEETSWMDVAPRGVSKASALDRLRERFGVASEATTAVGDGGNDLEMLRWAGRGVAMGHASAEVVAAADDITGSILDDGVATVLRDLLDEVTGAGPA